MEHIAKRFGAITAPRDVSVHLRRGEPLGLLGNNALITDSLPVDDRPARRRA